MEPRVSYVTLGVSNLERSVRFYEMVMRFPRLPSPKTSALFELGRVWLALYPRESLAGEIGVAAESSGFVGFMLSHNVHSAREVDRLLAELEAAGVKIRNRPKKVETKRGEEPPPYSAFIEDPDGFVWEISYNPFYPHT